MQQTTNKWLIWSNEHRMWWKPIGSGYTELKAESGRYSLEEAEGIVADANYYQEENEVPNEAMIPDNFFEGV